MSALDQVLSIPSVKAEHPNLHADATDEIATLRAQLAEAREGLKPFANVAKVWDGVSVMTSPIIAYSHADGDILVYLDDFRAARAWYEKVTTA